MTRKIIAVSGEPGTGKSTLFKAFMKDYTWETHKIPNVTYMTCKELDLTVLGTYEEGETFGGTDRLGLSVQPFAVEFVTNMTGNLLFEGDRLTNNKFYDFLLSLPGVEVEFIVLSVSDATRQARYKERGSNQSETFLKGRKTKISNITTNFEYMAHITEYNNENLADQAKILQHLKDSLC